MKQLTAGTSRLRRTQWILGALVLAVLASAVLLVRPTAAEPTGPAAADKHVTRAITILMNREHLTRHPLDNEISERWLDNYLKMLDPRKVFFTQSDVDHWRNYRDQLDDLAVRGDTTVAYRVFQQFLDRIDERVKLVNELVYQPHDFSVDEVMVTDPDEIGYAKNDAELRDRWRKRVKYELLDLELDKDLTGKEAQGKIAKRYQHLAKRMRQTDNDELLEMYLTALTTSYDPHTSYMSADTLENFEIQMRLKLEGIGAALEAPDGETLVKKIIPGGAAAKDGRLKIEDRIVGVGQGDEGPIVDVKDMKLNDVVSLIRGHSGTIVRLEVIPKGKPDPVVYAITRQQIELTDQEARSEILEAGKKPDGSPYKVGVINLPSFYMDMSGARNGREDFKSTTRDVAVLLDKFNREGVDAVVVDLRHNGGGSLTESINLTGLFIDSGPVVQVKDFDGQKTQYDDTERGVMWDGPLVVLTSKFSASASEIFAGAIQDYERGIIVGDTATHGKGTVQSLLDLSQRMFRGVTNAPQLGALKITMQQFYRPDGDSTQNRGVLADVVLPSISGVLDVGESSLDYAMKFDRVEAAEHVNYNMVDPRLLQALRRLSAERCSKSEDFQKLQKEIDRFNAQKEEKTISLKREKFMENKGDMSAEKHEQEEFEEMNDPNRPVVKRDYYFDEVLDITTDYVRMLGTPQAAAIKR
ncbi:MAG: tail-specific protease [Planctomycetota bacterium]|nr:MAG: tail-specific protease [Planctomycetota bacterium]